MLNDTAHHLFPLLPPLDVGSRTSLLPFLADHHLPYIVPAVCFWVISKVSSKPGHEATIADSSGFVFHFIDTQGLLSTYKLHTSAEDLTKNRASRKDVIKFALIQQAAQCLLGYLMADDTEQFVSPQYAIALWAQRLRHVQLLFFQGVQSVGLNLPWIMSASEWWKPTTSFAFSQDPSRGFLRVSTQLVAKSADIALPYTSNELMFAKVIYWILFPLAQYLSAMVLADTFQYFTHRAFHVNKWLYKHIHSMHHHIYVPFAYGAFYNHPLETIPIDGIGFPICLSLAGLDNRQAAFFGAIWTFKTVVDHCGYDFPYNPCNIVCPNSVLFHDLHHQTWGMKYNFSVYGAFWDWFMGTRWSPHDTKAQVKYRKGKAIAEAVAAKKQPHAQVLKPETGKSTAVGL